jgi:hypothetical protein
MGWGVNTKYQPITESYRANMDRIKWLKVVREDGHWTEISLVAFEHNEHGIKTLEEAYNIIQDGE